MTYSVAQLPADLQAGLLGGDSYSLQELEKVMRVVSCIGSLLPA